MVKVEVYPALWSRSFAREGRTGDQHDAHSIAAWLARADRVGSLAAFLNPCLAPAERTVAQILDTVMAKCAFIAADACLGCRSRQVSIAEFTIWP